MSLYRLVFFWLSCGSCLKLYWSVHLHTVFKFIFQILNFYTWGEAFPNVFEDHYKNSLITFFRMSCKIIYAVRSEKSFLFKSSTWSHVQKPPTLKTGALKCSWCLRNSLSRNKQKYYARRQSGRTEMLPVSNSCYLYKIACYYLVLLKYRIKIILCNKCTKSTPEDKVFLLDCVILNFNTVGFFIQ